jgi:hypothetical protein
LENERRVSAVTNIRRLAAGLLCLAAMLPALAQEKGNDKAVATLAQNPRGVYAGINLQPAQQMLQRLQSAAGGTRRPAMREVIKDAGAHIPPVLYALANALAEDDPDDAVFWYQVGRIRAVYDSLRCKDATARAGVVVIGRGLSVRLRHSMFYQRNQLVDIAQKAIEWDKKNPRGYDQRWIALYGKVAAGSPGTDPNEVFVPESEWPEILQRVHDAHLKSVQEFAAEKKGR